MRVPSADPLRMAPEEQAAVQQAVADVLRRGPLVLGPWVAVFEEALAAYLDPERPPEVVGLASGSDALQLALTALELPPGADVLVPANDGGFAAWATQASGLHAVAVDVDPRTHLVTPATLEAARTPDTAAAVVTHLHGEPVDVGALRPWADAQAIRLVEDCAQAHGARLHGEHVGLRGDVATFSFYPTKNLGALGDGGALVTRDLGIAEATRRRRTYGWGERFRIEYDGGRNSRLDALQAAVLSARLPFLDQNNARRRSIAARYAQTGVAMLEAQPGAVAHHAVALSAHREDLAALLNSHEIVTDVHYPWLVTEMPGLRVAAGPLPVADQARRHCLTLPCFPGLSEGAVDSVVQVLEAWVARG